MEIRKSSTNTPRNLFLIVGFALGLCEPIAAHDAKDPLHPAFSVITNSSASEAKLVVALDELASTAPTESPQIWTRVINDPKFTHRHRTRCAIQFFRRHVRSGMTLERLRNILAGAPWLTDEDMEIMSVSMGPPTVRMPANGMILVVRVLPKFGEQHAIYMSITLTAPLDRVRDFLIRNSHDRTVAEAQLIEVKAFEDYPRKRYDF